MRFKPGDPLIDLLQCMRQGHRHPCAEKLCRSPLLLKHILKILEAKCLGRMLRMYWESGCGDTQICCRWVPVERMDKRTNKHWISRLCIAPDFYFFSPASCSRTRNRSIMWKDKPSLRGPLPERFAIIHHHLPSSTIIHHHSPSLAKVPSPCALPDYPGTYSALPQWVTCFHMWWSVNSSRFMQHYSYTYI